MGTFTGVAWNALSTLVSSSFTWKLIGSLKGTRNFDIRTNLSVRTPLYYGQSPMFRQNSHIFSFKKTLYNADSLQYGQWTLNLGPRE